MSIILILLQLFNFQMRTLTSKFISLTSSSHRKVKGNPFIGGIVLFCRILLAFVATSPWIACECDCFKDLVLSSLYMIS